MGTGTKGNQLPISNSFLSTIPTVMALPIPQLCKLQLKIAWWQKDWKSKFVLLPGTCSHFVSSDAHLSGPQKQPVQVTSLVKQTYPGCTPDWRGHRAAADRPILHHWEPKSQKVCVSIGTLCQTDKNHCKIL